jgi:hypothetical protein
MYTRETTPPMPTYLSTPLGGFDSNWYPYSNNIHHLTSNVKNLNLKVEDYTGSDHIRIDNGKGLSIYHIGNTQLFSNFQFDMFDDLHVPNISKNMLFVHKFTKDANTVYELHPSYRLLKA